jgi:hypothetical protein
MIIIKDSEQIELKFSIPEIVKVCKIIHAEQRDLPYISFTTKLALDEERLLEFTPENAESLLYSITRFRNILADKLYDKALLNIDYLDCSKKINTLENNGILNLLLISFDIQKTGVCFISDSFGEDDIIISVQELKAFSLEIKYLL